MKIIMRTKAVIGRVWKVLGGWGIKTVKAAASPMRFVGKTAIGIGLAGIGVGVSNAATAVDKMAAAILVGVGTLLWILANLIDGEKGTKAE